MPQSGGSTLGGPCDLPRRGRPRCGHTLLMDAMTRDIASFLRASSPRAVVVVVVVVVVVAVVAVVVHLIMVIRITTTPPYHGKLVLLDAPPYFLGRGRSPSYVSMMMMMMMMMTMMMMMINLSYTRKLILIDANRLVSIET